MATYVTLSGSTHAKDRGEHRQAAKSSDKVALSCTEPSSTPEYDFFYPFRGGSVGGSQQSFPTLRHLQPKFPVVLVGSLRGKASTLVDLFFEKICFVEHCHNQKAPPP
jgi:hypothetical protein